MSEIERAAEVIGAYDRACALDPDNGEPATPLAMAQALADAGLLLTDADRAVLDAAEHWCHVRADLNWESEGWIDAVADADAALDEAVRALREATS